MSKKIASGAGKILIDIKVGKGALIENKKEAKRLANLMIKIGNRYDRKVLCMLTRMDNPLGSNIGNKLEIEEVIDILKNHKKNDLRTLAIEMASIMYAFNKNYTIEKARENVVRVLDNNEAYDKLISYVELLGGKIEETKKDPIEIKSLTNGYIKSINSRIIGETSMLLGAGRINKEDDIDYDAGVVLVKNVGDYVKKDEVICKLYGKEIEYNKIYEAYKFSKIKPLKKNIIIKVIE